MIKVSSKPLALHACCGPCSLEPLRLLQEEAFAPTIFWSNPNIQPVAEYDRRLETLLTWAEANNIETINCDVPQLRETWEAEVGPKAKAALLTTDPALRATRCRACYRLRLERSAAEAAKRGFHYFSTTLAVSPYQHFEECGEELAAAASKYGLEPVWRDFREHYPEATKRSRELGMYRQKYCGCRFSASEAALEKRARKAERKRQRAEKEREQQRQTSCRDELRRQISEMNNHAPKEQQKN